MLNQIWDIVCVSSKAYESIEKGLRVEVKGAKIGEKVFLCSRFYSPILVVASSLASTQEFRRNFVALGKKVAVLTDVLDTLNISDNSSSAIEKELVNVLGKLALNCVDVVVCYSPFLLQRVPSKKDFIKNVQKLCTNTSINVEKFISDLVRLGYSRVDEIESAGEFRVKGDTIDVILPNDTHMTRIEFFGDEIESIRKVSIEDFKTVNKLDEISIFPLRLGISGDNDKIPFDSKWGNLLSWFGLSVVIFDEPSRGFAQLEKAYEELRRGIGRRIVENILPKEYEFFYVSPFDCKVAKGNKCISFESLDVGNRYFVPYEKVFLSCPRNMKYSNDINALYLDLAQYNRKNFTIVLAYDSEEMRAKILTRLSAMNLAFKEDSKIVKNQINLIKSSIESGFGFIDEDFVLFSTKSFDIYPLKEQGKQDKSRVFYLPKVGDYVVHEKYGVAKCVAISRLNFGVSEKDYFVLNYANSGVLYVPSERSNELSCYVGESEPKLDILGSDSFKKAKAKARESVKKLAYDLKKLYAIRESKKGFAYEINADLMQEFSESFGFELTSDQSQAVEEIKSDLMQGKIMDRLICGDVGFGKTEVAMHASFLTVLNHKQVAVLCPTTVLCHQHYMSFSKRMADFGIKVGELSRFQTNAQNKKVIEDLKSGKIQIVCGTKRMLSGDVEFLDLGLLVLDEEQRFGVNDKEKIKTIKKDINVLTLSATPIPRTLNMSLMGVRDISLITTPPKNRQNVQTIVCEENMAFIKDACISEIERDGQVLVIYNRVEDIFEVANKIHKLVPNAKIGVAHGQMSRAELEAQIMDLYEHKIQIMVATTLIENGIDLPLANTLIVLNSDNFGLSQLYQLKGRVGRSNRRAYAYFMYKKENVLTQSAYERLKAIKDFASLGSGFKLAMRDLEIRGAGDILGANQHGHIAKLGYDMYCKLIEEALKEISGESVELELKKDVHIDVCLPAFIPHSFVPDENERIALYSKISNISALEQIDAFQKEIENSHSMPMPKEMRELCFVAYLKNIGQQLNLKKIEIKPNICAVEFYEKPMPHLIEILINSTFNQSLINSLKFEFKANIGALELQKNLINTLILLKNNEKKDCV